MKNHFKNFSALILAVSLMFYFIGCNNNFSSTDTVEDWVITGKLTNDSIYSIKVDLQINDSVKVNLDLSNTTGLTEIGDEAFKDCKNLMSIKLPLGVKTINWSSFENCSALEKIFIPKTVESIGPFAFAGCKKLFFEIDLENTKYKTSDDGKILLSEDKKTLLCYPSASGTVEIPNYVETIGDSAFYGCSEMTNAIIPQNVTTIQDAAFYLCSGLSKIDISKNIEQIGLIVFSQCAKLTFEVDSENPNYTNSADGKMLFTKDKKTLICYPSASGDVVIPDNVEIIGDSAFEACSSITSITIPNSVTAIEGGAFEGCSSLTALTIPESVSEIGIFAFDNCSGLKTITFEDTETWYKTLDPTYISGEVIDVSNPEENAKNLPELYDVLEIEGEEYPIPYYLYKE